MMTIDMTPVLQALIGVAATAITVGVPVLLNWLFGHWKNEAARRALVDAIGRAAAEAAAALPATVAGAGPIEVRTNSKAVAAGLGYLNKVVPDAVQRLNITPDTLATMLSAEVKRQAIAAGAPVGGPVDTSKVVMVGPVR